MGSQWCSLADLRICADRCKTSDSWIGADNIIWSDVNERTQLDGWIDRWWRMDILKHEILKHTNFCNCYTSLASLSLWSCFILTCPKIGPFKFGIGNIGKIGICIFGMGNGGGKGKGNIGLNANEVGDDNNNVAETYKKALSVNMLTRFRCSTRNGKMMTDIDCRYFIELSNFLQ